MCIMIHGSEKVKPVIYTISIMKSFLNVDTVPAFHGSNISHLWKSMFIKTPKIFSVNLTLVNQEFYNF